MFVCFLSNNGLVGLFRYYSSKYPYPGLPLGPRFEFAWVPYSERLAGSRHYMFNFMGSITKVESSAIAAAAATQRTTVFADR